MPQTKIAFFDIDGTLIDMQTKQITPKTVEALHRLQDSGVKLCIATGRSPMVLPKIADIEFDAYLTFNGSLCYDKQGVIFSNPIPHADVLQFIRNAAARCGAIAFAPCDIRILSRWNERRNAA